MLDDEVFQPHRLVAFRQTDLEPTHNAPLQESEENDYIVEHCRYAGLFKKNEETTKKS